MKITKYHIVGMLVFLGVIIISNIRYDRYWEKQTNLTELTSFDMTVSNLHVNHGVFSFNDSIKGMDVEFELLDTFIKDFDWINFEIPFQIIREEGSDTLRLIQKDRKELKFKIK